MLILVFQFYKTAATYSCTNDWKDPNWIVFFTVNRQSSANSLPVNKPSTISSSKMLPISSAYIDPNRIKSKLKYFYPNRFFDMLILPMQYKCIWVHPIEKCVRQRHACNVNIHMWRNRNCFNIEIIKRDGHIFNFWSIGFRWIWNTSKNRFIRQTSNRIHVFHFVSLTSGK